jgi:hypothetical protein
MFYEERRLEEREEVEYFRKRKEGLKTCKEYEIKTPSRGGATPQNESLNSLSNGGEYVQVHRSF